jgi:hypothetical protein
LGGRGAPPGKTTKELLSARTQAEMESVLEAARLNDRELNGLIKDVGSSSDSRDVEKLDWLLSWLNSQTGLKLDVYHYSAFITQLGRRRR